MNNLSAELSDKFDKIIDELYEKINISCIILADLNGQLITFRKDDDDFNETNLAILFASHIGTTREISREVKDKNGFNYLLHEGNDQCVFLSSIDKSYVLGLIFENSAQIGAVRLFAKKACSQLTELLYQENPDLAPPAPDININRDFVDSLSDECDNLFNL
ncbi:hypothetical protein GF337_12220 [candidate division KSB1 bacterium]|nr:hypothetical protein [candidate division KSB1 bacterium]